MARRTAALRTEDSGIHAVPRAPRPRREPRPLGVVDQVRVALRRQNRLATVLGGLLGAVVPVASYWLAHEEVQRTAELWTQLPAWLVLGGLMFSATTVYGWGRLAFRNGAKALGFVVLVEGVLVCSSTPWLSVVALVYLCAINAIATGCTLSLRTAG